MHVCICSQAVVSLHSLVPSCAQDFYDYCQKEELTSPDQLPYFEGDFWPNVIEEQIKELDHELEEERKLEAEEADVSHRGKGRAARCCIGEWVECRQVLVRV